MRPCADRHPEPRSTAESCTACKLYLRNPKYRRLWSERSRLAAMNQDGSGTVEAASIRSGLFRKCISLGEDLGERVACGPRSKCKAKVHECGVHGACTIGRNAADPPIQSCALCHQFVAAAPQAGS